MKPSLKLSSLAWLLFAIPVLPLVAPAPAEASHTSSPAWEAAGDLVDIQILVEGRHVPLYLAPGRFDRQYFQAFRGKNYSLEVRNLTGNRVGVLIAVDGLNVVNGERSRLSSREAMYVLDPWESAEIRGWRTSLRDVRKFVFVDEERSYAERSGQANGDMGWIRVLSFREMGGPWLSQRWWDRLPGRRAQGDERSQAPRGEDSDRGAAAGEGEPQAGAGRLDKAPGAEPRSASPEEGPALKSEGNMVQRDESNPGTGWGDRSWDPVNRTTFFAESHATDHIVLRYEYASGLRALGIDLRRNRDRLWEREEGDFGFAQPPRW